MIKVRPNLPAAVRLLHEGQIAFAEMEHNGIRIDEGYLDATMADIKNQIADLQEDMRSDKVWVEWKKAYSDRAKLGSREQLAHVMFKCLGFEKATGKKSKKRSEDSGDSYKKESQWDEASFANVDLPFIKLYFKCEKLKKLKSTYLDGIKRETVDGFLHPMYNLNKAITYRSSSDTPNFQNIPSRNFQIAEMVRRCYIPRKGNHLVEIDYGGIEVRISACYNNDPNLIRYIEDPTTDMHRDMAAFLYMMPVEFLVKHKDWAKKSVRDWSKNRFVFPEFYGSIFCQCAADLWRPVLQHKAAGLFMPDGKTTIKAYLKSKGIKRLGGTEFDDTPRKGEFVYRVKEAEDYLWQTMFPVYTSWKKQWYEQYLKRGWFDMHTGFRVEGLLKKNDVLNYSIQGSAFHCTLQAIIWIMKELRRRKMKTKIIGQIHDCIIADVPPNELQDYLTLAREIMAERLPREWKWIIVPLEVEIECCEQDQSWNNKRVWTEKSGIWSPK